MRGVDPLFFFHGPLPSPTARSPGPPTWTCSRDEFARDSPLHQRVGANLTFGTNPVRLGRPASPSLLSFGILRSRQKFLNSYPCWHGLIARAHNGCRWKKGGVAPALRDTGAVSIDMAIMAELASGICAGVERSIQFFHMPVPKNRTDDAYFAPLV